MLHLLQDLFLKNIPGHCALQIQNKWITKPAGKITAARFSLEFDVWWWWRSIAHLCSLTYLRPCCPAQALLHTSRTIFSACPLFLLGLWGGVVVGSCICVDILLLSVPYFRLFWLRFACGLPERNTQKILFKKWTLQAALEKLLHESIQQCVAASWMKHFFNISPFLI